MNTLLGKINLMFANRKLFTFTDVKEFFLLLGIKIKTAFRNAFDFFNIVIRYYPNLTFAKADLLLAIIYLFNSPYSFSKRFLQKKGEKEVYTYGETPLRSMEQISKEANLTSKDTIFELGSGRGRTCFWLNAFIKARVIGIEYIPEFVQNATQIKDKLGLQKIEFRNEDMFKADLMDATAIYLYGTCLDDEQIKRLIERFKTLPKGTKIITVSYPLDDESFELLKCFESSFTWGKAEVYFHIRK